VRTSLSIAGTLVLVMLGALPTFAQAPAPRPERPYRGVFGGGISNMDETLIFNADVGAGYSDTIRTGPTTSEALQNSAATSGGVEAVSLGLAYNLSRKKVSFMASANSTLANYSTRSESLVQSQSGSLGATFQLARKTALSVTENISYSPYLFSTSVFGLPAMTAAPVGLVDLDAGAGLDRVLVTDTSVGLTQSLSRRTSLSFYYSGNRTRSDTDARDFSADSGGGRLSISLSKGLAIRLGYRFTSGSYANNQRFQNSFIDSGLDFNRALSLSRRMTLSFGTGFAAITYGSHTEYTALGNVTLAREIGRTWNASISYRRNLSVYSTLQAPVLYDSGMFDLAGLFGPRLAFQAGVGASLGNVGASSQPNNGFRNYYAITGLTYGMTRLVGLGVDYVYYHYNFDSNVILPTGLAEWADRQTILVSTKLWLPLLTRTRRVNVTR
jgi:hypothetical protein